MNTAQHQATSAHIATPHEFCGKQEAFAEDLKERICIFRGCDASEQDDGAAFAGSLAKNLCIAVERGPIAVRRIYISDADFSQAIQRNHCKGFREKESALRLPAHTGVGLRGIRERLRLLGGTLNIQSNDQGTRVTAIIPVVHARAKPAAEEVTSGSL